MHKKYCNFSLFIFFTWVNKSVQVNDINNVFQYLRPNVTLTRIEFSYSTCYSDILHEEYWLVGRQRERTTHTHTHTEWYKRNTYISSDLYFFFYHEFISFHSHTIHLCIITSERSQRLSFWDIQQKRTNTILPAAFIHTYTNTFTTLCLLSNLQIHVQIPEGVVLGMRVIRPELI